MATKRNRLRLLEFSGLLTLIVFLTDLQVSLNIAVPAFYAVGIVLVARQQRIGPVLFAASICSFLTFVPVIAEIGTNIPQSAWENRFIAIGMIWIAAAGDLIYLRQAQLKQNIQKQLAPFFENSSLAVSIKDFRNHSVWINQQFRKLIGPADQVPGFTIVNATQPATGEPIVTNLVNHREIKWHHNPLIDDLNRTVGTLCLGMDLTDQKRYEQALKTSVEQRTAELTQINKNLRQEIAERKRAEKELLAASKRTHDILDSLFVFVSVYSIEGILLEINRAPLDAANIKKSDVIGKPFWESYRWTYSAEVLSKMRNAMKGAAAGQTIRYDTKARISDQKLIDLDITFSPLYDVNGNVIQIIASAADITNRLLAEKCVVKKTAQLQAMLEVNPDFFFHLKADGTILGYESGKQNNLFPIADDSLHRNINELLPQSVAHQFDRAIQCFSHCRTPTSFEYSLNFNQRPHWFQARLLPYQSKEILVIIQDINERKVAEIEMNNMHNRLFEAQRLAHIGSWEWNIQDQTVWWSEEVYCIFGLDITEFQPSYVSCMEMIHEDDRELVQRVITNTLQNDLPFNIELRIKRPNGEVRHVLAQAALKKSLEGEKLLLYGTIQDLTEKHETSNMVQEYRDELAHVSRLAVMGELAAGLSHELNQPLTAIANYSSSLRYLLDQGGDISELVSKIEAQSLRSGDIVRRLKNLAEKRKQERLLFNIHESVRNALQLMNYQIRLNQIQVEVKSENKFPTVFADRVQIEQVLLNLVKNAVEAMEDTAVPRVLTITIETGNDSATLISVADTGNGIPEELKQRLFTPFTTNKKEGLGIGLSLSRSLIDASDGKIWYRQNSDGGATFHISLPFPKQTKKVG
ncbi:ATP-binding protein [uncultured Gimesia sp.]|uniref:PAS domain-containing sensor histidine kinase n=1 Tax=uncultured Gimesia sp. TaxID=1678688 RepID=UPI0030DC0A0A|tara:strand:- start:37912 stop:40500 length:2589 start_codon:yes stop_codon:yes gene_type:complete